jgi:conjugative transfer signal peptidase TraF
MTRSSRIAATTAAALALGLSALSRPAPKLIWNASASVPIGLYAVRPAGALHVDELLVVMSPEPFATFLDERRYLPQGVPLLKRVLALPGQTVCRSDRTITVDGVTMGDALDRDHLSRPLPIWFGCRVVGAGDVFLMNRQSGDSFDGRYFGPLPTTTIVGRAEPLWIDQEH